MTTGRDSEARRSSPVESSDDEGSSTALPWYLRVYERVTPRFIRRRLAAKFLTALLLVVVLIGAIGVVTYVQIQGTIQQDATEKLETTAELQSSSISEWVDGLHSQTSLIAGSDKISEDATITEVDRYLQRAMASGSETIVGLHYVDLETEQVLVSTRPGYTGLSLTDVEQEWEEPLSQPLSAPDSVAVSNQSYRVDDRHVVAFVSTVRDSKRLILVSRFSDRTVAESSMNASIRTYLLNRQEQGVLSGDPVRVNELTSVDAFSAAAWDGTTRTVKTGGEVRTYTPIEGTGWIAVSAAETSQLYSVSQTVGRNVIVLVVAALVSLVAIGIVLGRSTVVPLAQLKRKTREIEEGSLDVDLETAREDEIGRLYRAFDSMRGALRQQVQQARQAKQDAESSRKEMERQNRRLDQFASTMSHDLRNPLAVARGHVELLTTKLDDQRNGLHEHVTKIDDAHDRIDSIINDVLTLTRKGESVEETERIALGGIAEEAWANIDNKDATLRVEDSIGIEGDRTRLLRAFENLFRNAIDHVGPDVTVTVGLTEDGFYVEDDGPGIPDEEMDSIFEYGHTTSEDGTGLGLSIVKTIAEAHGWSLWIDGTSGRGARFVFSDVFETEEKIFEQSAFTWDHASGDD